MSRQPRQEEQCYNWEPATQQLETESIRVQGCQEEWETWLNIFPNTSPPVPCDESPKMRDSEPDAESINGGNADEIAPAVVDEGKTRRNTWTTAEHRRFLAGLKENGKKWTRISRDFVVTKSPSQVASHAQKYFLRQRVTTEQRKRESIHDITTDNNDLVHQPQPQIKEALLHNVSRIVPGHVELPILVDDLKEEEEEEVTAAEMLEEEMIAIELDDGVRKGKPWTGEEHWLFLVGLEEFGKGKWTSIARYWVVSRTPSQVASHAQKYFLRQSRKERKRKSIHDITMESFDLVPELHHQYQSQAQFQPQPQSRPRCISHGQLGCLFCEKKNGL